MDMILFDNPDDFLSFMDNLQEAYNTRNDEKQEE